METQMLQGQETMAKLRSLKWQRPGTWKLQPWGLRVKKKQSFSSYLLRLG